MEVHLMITSCRYTKREVNIMNAVCNFKVFSMNIASTRNSILYANLRTILIIAFNECSSLLPMLHLCENIFVNRAKGKFSYVTYIYIISL